MPQIVPVFVVILLAVATAGRAQVPPPIAEVQPLLDRLHTFVESADRQGFLTLLSPESDLDAAGDFAAEALSDNVTRAVVRPRLLVPKGDAPDVDEFELTVEVFTESGDRARLQTWILDIKLSDTDPDQDEAAAWMITDHEALVGLSGLHHLTLNQAKQFDAVNLVIAAEDMTLSMPSGSVFVSEIDTGVTGLVLVGDGTMTFEPEPDAERSQVRIFSGSETLETRFSRAFIRLNPEMFASRVSSAALTETPVDSGDLDKALKFFDDVISLSYAVDLSDLSEREWWLNPSVGDLIAEILTRQYGLLTYANAQNQPEDVTLYRREPFYRVIALYASARQRAVHGRYFDDQDAVSYDVLDYDIDASIEPRGTTQESLRTAPVLEGCWIEGTTRLAVRVTGVNFRSMTLRLADELKVHSVVSRELGPLFFFRMSGSNSIVITLPRTAPVGTEFTVALSYSGLLAAQATDENWLGRSRFLFGAATPFNIGTRRYLYSSSSSWYPQSIVRDYATATMRLTVPADYGIVASGDPDEGNPPVASFQGETGVRSYEFVTLQPAKYLSAIISKFSPSDIPIREIALDHGGDIPNIPSGVLYDRTVFSVESNPRSVDRVGEFYEQASDILGFYGSLMRDLPYPSFTLALTDSRLPGGHSPAYFAVLNQPLPLNPGMIISWRTDPVAFSDVEYFFLAHELAHQWWGQAVGWKNYHEQWLSEALSQYFAALYVREDRGEEAFEDILSQMRRWAIRHSAEGPVYLGYRLGVIEDEPRVYRSLVYNKGALVLHMLRRLIGDDAFFGGLRRYYGEMRFRRAGTDDLIRAFETESARSLENFFDRWIHEADLPELRFDYQTEDRQGQTDVVLRFEQGPKLFEVPVTVTLKYRSGEEETVIVPVAEHITEVRLPLRGRLRDVEVNADDAALTEIRR